MKLTNTEIAAKIGIHPTELTRKSTNPHGNFLCWLCREILMNEIDQLCEPEIDYLIDIIRMLIRPNFRVEPMLSELYTKRIFVFRYPLINNLARLYFNKNPFGIRMF